MPTTFTPYQVDFSIKNTSKTFGFSKKRVSFKFGIANNQALSEGLTGAHCRGSEHEIIFIWSLNSGKRQILADGKEVHYSESGQNGWTADQVFQHHFQLRSPNLSQPLKCHLITQPRNPEMPQIQPFDVRVNGISYFSMSKIFQLGTSAMRSKQIKGRSSAGGATDPEEDPYCTPEERRAIAQAKLESLRELRTSSSQDQGGQNMPAKEEQSLISFDDPPPMPSGAPPGRFMSSVTLDPSLQNQSQPPPAQGGGYNNYSLGGSGGYGQQPQQQQYGQNNQFGQQQQQQQPQQSNAMQPYYGGQQQSYGDSQQSYGSGQQQSYGSAQQPSYGSGQQQSYGTGQQQSYGSGQQQQSYNSFTPAPAPTLDTYTQAYGSYGGGNNGAPVPDFASPTNSSTYSYGSAPSFAQPPQYNQQQQQQQQQPQYNNNQGYSQQYSQPPPPQGFPQPHY
jgi:hypothetical protein